MKPIILPTPRAGTRSRRAVLSTSSGLRFLKTLVAEPPPPSRKAKARAEAAGRTLRTDPLPEDHPKLVAEYTKPESYSVSVDIHFHRSYPLGG